MTEKQGIGDQKNCVDPCLVSTYEVKLSIPKMREKIKILNYEDRPYFWVT